MTLKELVEKMRGNYLWLAITTIVTVLSAVIGGTFWATRDVYQTAYIEPLRDDLERRDKQITELREEIQILHSQMRPDLEKKERQIEELTARLKQEEEIIKSKTEFEGSLTQALAERDKLTRELSAYLKKREDELNKEKLALKEELDGLLQGQGTIDKIKQGRNLIEFYLKECAGVDLSVGDYLSSNLYNGKLAQAYGNEILDDYQRTLMSDPEYRKNYQKAKNILHAIEAIGHTLDRPNEFLDFVNSHKSGVVVKVDSGGGG